jgi:hypothetical protein
MMMHTNTERKISDAVLFPPKELNIYTYTEGLSFMPLEVKIHRWIKGLLTGDRAAKSKE